jgi:hypothetical protein
VRPGPERPRRGAEQDRGVDAEKAGAVPEGARRDRGAGLRPDRKHAEGLLIISKQAEWKALKTPLYEVYSNEFRRKAEGLIENAKKKNVDAAALSYVDLTLTCVKCHKHVREKRMARLD